LDYTTANEQLKELLSLADEKATLMWKGYGMASVGCLCAQTNKASQAVQIITSALAVARSVGAAILMPWNLSNLARAHAELGEFDDALRCIAEAIAAIEGSEERWMEPEVHRIAGEIWLRSPERDGAKASAHFERALEVARKQKAKSWELRAAMSVARLWRDRGRRDEARELLAPVYGWFTEGFDTIDLKEAKALLGELAP
jgi:predicted ATPase